VFDKTGAKFYPYGYEEYELIEREKEQAAAQEKDDSISEKVEQKPSGKKTFSTPLKEKGKKERRAKKLEELIGNNETEIEKLNSLLASPDVYSDYLKVTEIEEKLNALRLETDAYTEEWLEILEFLEND
jgi:ATP-binding cassette subfamily F protein 3